MILQFPPQENHGTLRKWGFHIPHKSNVSYVAPLTSAVVVNTGNDLAEGYLSKIITFAFTETCLGEIRHMLLCSNVFKWRLTFEFSPSGILSEGFGFRQ